MTRRSLFATLLSPILAALVPWRPEPPEPEEWPGVDGPIFANGGIEWNWTEPPPAATWRSAVSSGWDNRLDAHYDRL